MTIKLEPQARRRFLASIKRYFAEQLDDDIGDLKAEILLEFVMKEIAPTIYNRAVADAQARAQLLVSELDTACFEPDLGFWSKR